MIRAVENIQVKFLDPTLETNIEPLFINALEKEYSKRDIKSYFKDLKDIEITLEIVTKEDLDRYLLTNFKGQYSKVPEWVCGHTDRNGIKLVLTKTIEYSAKVAIHEIVHFTTFSKRKEEGLRILDEAIASYIAGQISNARIQKLSEEKYNLKTIQYFIDLNNNSAMFGQKNGYTYSYFLAEFLVHKYSKERLVEYVLNTKKFKQDLKLLEGDYNNYLLNVIYNSSNNS